MRKGLTLLKVIHVLVVVISCGLCCCRFMDRVFNFSLVLLTWPPSVNICGRRRGRKSRNNGLATGALFFSPPLVSRFALRAKCHVRLAWPIKRLLCRLANLWFILLLVTKGFRFQNNRNDRFISGNCSSERFSWKVKTIYVVHKFTLLKRTWPIFAKTVINFALEFRIKTFWLRSSQMIRKHNLDKIIINSFLWISKNYWVTHKFTPKFFSISSLWAPTFTWCAGSQ